MLLTSLRPGAMYSKSKQLVTVTLQSPGYQVRVDSEQTTADELFLNPNFPLPGFQIPGKTMLS